MPVRNTIRALFRDGPHIPADEAVVFFPTVGSQRADGGWDVPIHGWAFRPAELSRLRRAALRVVKHALRHRVPADHPGMPLFERRAGAFLADNSRWARVHVRVGEAVHAMKRSRPDGHFSGTIVVPGDAGGWVDYEAAGAAGDKRRFAGRAQLLPAEGLSVISDIDDTVKVTEVHSRRKMLANTFLRDFASVPAMAALYRRWAETRAAAFHYISASPWQLYPFLAEFLKGQGFPEGSFHLRDFRLMPKALYSTLRFSRRVKLGHARRLLRQFPQRRFVLVGDSGESDPAIYAALARQFPGQVEKILIRDVGSGASAWSTAVAPLTPDQWQVFRDPAELA